MPDFTARPTAGVTVTTWLDPESGALATRIRPIEGIPHLRWLVTTVQVTVKCTPDGGTEGALDAALGGRLFMVDWLETPAFEPVLSSPGANSSVISFTPVMKGHYALWIYRPEGGGVILHFDKDT